MTNIYLYGALGRKFGYRFKFDISSPGEAVRALMANFSDFQRYMIQHSLPGYQIFIGPDPIPGPEGLQYPVGRQAIKIVPVVAGAAKSGIIPIIIGVVIIAAAVALGPLGWGVIGGYAALSVGFIGAGLVLNGVTTLLAGAPKAPEPFEPPQNKPSNLFNGPVNTTAQGQPVPIGYGRLRVGSAVISAGITTTDIAP
jgi:predicted phage tail protein